LAYVGSTVTWLRNGPGPDVQQPTFDYSTDNSNWVTVAQGERITGGWRASKISLPKKGFLRARGYVVGDDTWFTESLVNAPWPIHLEIFHNPPNLLLNWTGGQGPYQVQQTTNLTLTNAWQNVGPPMQTNFLLIPDAINPSFFRVHEP